MSKKMTNYILVRRFILAQSIRAWRVSMKNYFLLFAARLFAIGMLLGLFISFKYAIDVSSYRMLGFAMLVMIAGALGCGISLGLGAILFHFIYSVLFPRRILLWLSDADRTGEAKIIGRIRRYWE